MSNNPGTSTIGGNISSSESERERQDPGTLRAKAHQVREQVREQISETTRETTSRVKAEGEHLLTDQKDRMAERISHYGSAVHRAADKLEDDQDAAIAHHIHRAAEQFDRAASYLRSRDWRGLRRDVEGVARRHPEIFFGGLLVVGLAVARLLKASQDEEEDKFRDESTRSPAVAGNYGMGTSADYPTGYATPAYTPSGTTLPQSSTMENPNI